ncbi:MAG: FAD-dependent oxidoreductase, partial [Clostridia bacterium]|nr:FAD-dependent oxidoreductase [Clostridia bacterium]
HLKGNGVKLLTEAAVEKITATEVIYKSKDGKTNSVKADTVVVAIGTRPEVSLYESLKDDIKEIYNIGDSNGGGIIPNAVYEGYTVGNRI